MNLVLFVSLVIITSLICLELVQPVDRKWWNKGKTILPGGPHGLPLLGNLLQFRKARREGGMKSYLLEMSRYGDMTTLHMGSQLWVLLNTDQVARDLIGTKSSVTSERPHMPVASGLVSDNKRTVLQRSSAWTEPRRLMHQLLSVRYAESFAAWQDRESIQVLLSTLEEPAKWYQHQARYGTAVVYGVVVGERLSKSDEEMAEYRQITAEFLGSLFSSIIDFFPVLEHLPIRIQVWRPFWHSRGKRHRQVFENWWNSIKTIAQSNISNLSWVQDVVLHKRMDYRGTEEEAMYLVNSVISAGGDNTRMTLNTFILASVCYPAAFQKCREKIDFVCGADATRLPRLEDASSMPYVCAFIKEVLRWRPIVPLVPPHQLTEKLRYKGYVFPKGTNFVINTFAICADCDQPDEFRPERWLDGNEGSLTHGFWGFGGGRRVCIGYRAAQSALFLAISRLVYCFDFECPTDGIHGIPPERLPLISRKRSSLHESLIAKAGLEQGLCA